jgi:hypothetical protein
MNTSQEPDATGDSLEQAEAEITQLHREVMGTTRLTLHRVIHIGSILSDIKTRHLKHGQWEKWMCIHLDFDLRTAQNYLRLYNRRGEVIAKSESVSYLGVTDAYRALIRCTQKPQSKLVPLAAVQNTEEPSGFADQTTFSGSEVTCSPKGRASTPMVSQDEKLLVAALTSEQADQILAFLRQMKVGSDAHQLLRGDGKVRRWKATLAQKITPYLTDISDQETSQ